MRRKPEWEIKKEIDEYFSKKYIPVKKNYNKIQIFNKFIYNFFFFLVEQREKQIKYGE